MLRHGDWWQQGPARLEPGEQLERWGWRALLSGCGGPCGHHDEALSGSGLLRVGHMPVLEQTCEWQGLGGSPRMGRRCGGGVSGMAWGWGMERRPRVAHAFWVDRGPVHQEGFSWAGLGEREHDWLRTSWRCLKAHGSRVTEASHPPLIKRLSSVASLY